MVIVGVPGLRWEDVSETTTPHLWNLAEHGSIGSLSVRSALRPTCPVDGWLTLGAGNYAGWERTEPVTAACPPSDVVIERPDGIGAFLPDLDQLAVRYNQESLTWGAVPGALAESVRCTVAVGPGAAVAAARPFGRVDRYEPELPADPGPLLSSCVLSMIDLGAVAGDDPSTRQTQAARADAELARVLAARPERSLVIVAGLADTDQSSRLHVAVADGPGWDGGWLTSSSTGRDGYVQLVDLAPTALAALGRPQPERLFAGQPARAAPGRPADLPDAVTFPTDADREAGARRTVATWFFGLLAFAQFALAVAVVPLLRRARRQADGGGPPRRRMRGTRRAAAGRRVAVDPGRAGRRRGAVVAQQHARVDLRRRHRARARAGHAGGAARARFGRTLGPLGVVAPAAALVVGVDLFTGARLQLNGVAGYSALEGNRYAGVGTVGLGVFLSGVLLSAGLLAQRVPRSWRPAVMAVVGGAGVLLVGSPYLGADPVGAVALTAGVSIATAICTGGWLSLGPAGRRHGRRTAA